jgi:hypothetical protein
MKNTRCLRLTFLLIVCVLCEAVWARAGESAALQIGLAVRDITPPLPIWLAGYAGRKKPADKVDHPLLVQALAMRNPTGERFVLVALDNCEVNHSFVQPICRQLADQYQLPQGTVAIISSHTHSGPVLAGPLDGMYPLSAADEGPVARYTRTLQARIVEVVGAALHDFQPALLEHGVGRATFAMNRRIYTGDKVSFGDNPDGPADWDVPVLRVKGTNGAVRAILFGYGCHGTSVRTGDDWYVVSGEYMAYARQHLEALQPGAMAMFLTGMGADSDPAPRGHLLEAKRHGLELAGAIIGVLDRPMRPVNGALKIAYEEVELPFVDLPTREQMQKDAASKDTYVQQRARNFLALMDAGKPVPKSVPLPVAVVRLGDQLTFVLMGGEVVVDYSRRLKRLLAAEHPWLIGYAYEVPAYIPSVRLIKEGGYESDYSLLYYGFYGPFRTSIEDLLVNRVLDLVKKPRGDLTAK